MTTPAASSDASPATASTILLLSLNKESFWDEQYSTLVDALSSKAAIKRATKIGSAMRYLADNTPSAILITDAALTERDSKFDDVREKVSSFVRNGGTAVIGTHFSSFVRPTDLDHWFSETWGLSWENGDYYRTTSHLNRSACGGRFDRPGLPEQYSQKAVMLNNVTRDAAVYLPADSSRVESNVFPADAVDTHQTAVAFAKVGNGWLGYVGDVNNEMESQTVIMAMCGL